MTIPFDDLEVKAQCLGSLLFFTKTFFKLRTGRVFKISEPIARESHHIQIARDLMRVYDGSIENLNINIFPRSGKTELLIFFVAWAIANYPDSNFIYASYSHFLATKATQAIREIISMPNYRKMFGVTISDSSGAKDNFTTTAGGTVFAAGTGGTITGFGAGIRGVTDRFSGAFIVDDSLKPDEATSDTIRQGVIDWWFNTAQSRLNNGNRTPVIHIGQRVHEADLPALFIAMDRWSHLILPSLDSVGNALDPDMYSRDELLAMQDKEPYVFAAQHQQDPQPAGGGIFKPEWFVLTDPGDEPEILETFITVDSAGSLAKYADFTVYAFFGLTRIKQFGIETDLYGLHVIDFIQERIEPKDLQNEFMAFYANCMRHKIKPRIAAIENKSTGITLYSVLKGLQGLQVIPVERTAASGSKTARFLAMQPYVAQKLISIDRNGKNTQVFLDHMRKISAGNVHLHDDLCFVAGTQIATQFGYKNIEDIKIGDKVITPFGLGRVSACGCTGEKEVITRRGLTGTSEHKIFTENGFFCLDTLHDALKLDILLFGGILKWQYKKILCLMELHTGLLGRKNIILVHQRVMKEGGIVKDFMLQFGSFIAERKCKKAISFIIKMGTILTTTTAIWSVFLIGNTWHCMLKNVVKPLIQINSWSIWQKLESKLRFGMQAKKVMNGIRNMQQNFLIKSEERIAKFVGKSSLLEHLKPCIAGSYAAIEFSQTLREKGESAGEHLMENVLFVANNLQPKIHVIKIEEEKPALETVALNLRNKQPVYNLTVENFGVYYANDILVSNCDATEIACSLALRDKTIGGMFYHKEEKIKQKDMMTTMLSQHKTILRTRHKSLWG